MAASTTSYRIPDPCDHKPTIGCMLTALPCCCSCADKRPQAAAYPVYVDGEGMRMKGRRWQRYCRKCYDSYESLAMQTRVTQRTNTTTLSIPPESLATFLQSTNPAAALDIDTSTQPRPSRENRVQTYPLGTLEDVQRDDYESPIGAMFFRAWDRYRTAEEVRQAEAQSTTFQVENDENTPPYRNPLAAFPSASTSPPNLNPLASPFNPPRPSGRAHETGPARLRNIPHRPRANFHTPFYFGHRQHHHIQSLPQPEPDPMEERPNPVDAQILQRPAPSQPEDLKMDFACKVCVEQKINTFCEPCMHACMCQWCAAIVRDECRTETGRFDGRLWKCPICRARITQVRKFYIE